MKQYRTGHGYRSIDSREIIVRGSRDFVLRTRLTSTAIIDNEKIIKAYHIEAYSEKVKAHPSYRDLLTALSRNIYHVDRSYFDNKCRAAR